MKKLKLKLSVIWAVIRSRSFYFVEFIGNDGLSETMYGVSNKDLNEISLNLKDRANENN